MAIIDQEQASYGSQSASVQYRSSELLNAPKYATIITTSEEDLKNFFEIKGKQTAVSISDGSVTGPTSSNKFTPEENSILEQANQSATDALAQSFLDAYMNPDTRSDIEFRIGTVVGVNNTTDLKGPQFDNFGNIKTYSNFDLNLPIRYVDGSNNEVVETVPYVNYFFPPLKAFNGNKNKYTSKVGWWEAYDEYKNRNETPPTFREDKLLRSPIGATYRSPSYKLLNDNITMFQTMFEHLSGVVSTYLSEWDLSLYMQEGLCLQDVGEVTQDETGSKRTTTYKKNVYFGLTYNMSSDAPSYISDPNTLGVVNCATSKTGNINTAKWDISKYPLSMYWVPYTESFDKDGVLSWYSYRNDMKKFPAGNSLEYNSTVLNYNKNTTVRFINRLRFDDWQNACLSGYKNLSAIPYWRALYNNETDGLDDIDNNIDDAYSKPDLIDANFASLGGDTGDDEVQSGGDASYEVIDDSSDCNIGEEEDFKILGVRLKGSALLKMFLKRNEYSNKAQNAAGSTTESSVTNSWSKQVAADAKTLSGADKVPATDEAGNEVSYVGVENEATKYSTDLGLSKWNPTFFGGPHGRNYSPETVQGYFEPYNQFLRNIPRVTSKKVLSQKGDSKHYYGNGNEIHYYNSKSDVSPFELSPHACIDVLKNGKRWYNPINYYSLDKIDASPVKVYASAASFNSDHTGPRLLNYDNRFNTDYYEKLERDVPISHGFDNEYTAVKVYLGSQYVNYYNGGGWGNVVSSSASSSEINYAANAHLGKLRNKWLSKTIENFNFVGLPILGGFTYTGNCSKARETNGSYYSTYTSYSYANGRFYYNTYCYGSYNEYIRGTIDAYATVYIRKEYFYVTRYRWLLKTEYRPNVHNDDTKRWTIRPITKCTYTVSSQRNTSYGGFWGWLTYVFGWGAKSIPVTYTVHKSAPETTNILDFYSDMSQRGSAYTDYASSEGASTVRRNFGLTSSEQDFINKMLAPNIANVRNWQQLVYCVTDASGNSYKALVNIPTRVNTRKILGYVPKYKDVRRKSGCRSWWETVFDGYKKEVIDTSYIEVDTTYKSLPLEFIYRCDKQKFTSNGLGKNFISSSYPSSVRAPSVTDKAFFPGSLTSENTHILTLYDGDRDHKDINGNTGQLSYANEEGHNIITGVGILGSIPGIERYNAVRAADETYTTALNSNGSLLRKSDLHKFYSDASINNVSRIVPYVTSTSGTEYKVGSQYYKSNATPVVAFKTMNSKLNAAITKALTSASFYKVANDTTTEQCYIDVTNPFRILYSIVLNQGSWLKNIRSIVNHISLESTSSIISTSIDKDILKASAPGDAGRYVLNKDGSSTGKESMNYSYWIQKAIAIFQPSSSYPSNAKDQLAAFKTQLDSRISLYDYNEKKLKAMALNTSYKMSDVDDAVAAVDAFWDLTYNPVYGCNNVTTSIEEFFMSYLHVLYQYRRYFINKRFNKMDGTYWQLRGLEKVANVALAESIVEDIGNPEDLLYGTSKHAVILQQLQNTVSSKVKAITSGTPLASDKVKYVFVEVVYYNGKTKPIDVGNGRYKDSFGQELIYIPLRKKYAYRPLDGKYKFTSKTAEKAMAAKSQYEELCKINPQCDIPEGYITGFEMPVFNIKWNEKEITSGESTSWSVLSGTQTPNGVPSSIWFDFHEGIDFASSVMKSDLDGSNPVDDACSSTSSIDLWGIQIPDAAMPYANYYKSQPALELVDEEYDSSTAIKSTVVGGCLFHTLWPVKEKPDKISALFKSSFESIENYRNSQ